GQGEVEGRRALGRHEAPAHHRTRPHQRSAHPAAGRADHGAGPAGSPRAVGPALPPQGARHHPRAHDALHGRGRAAVRPAHRRRQGPHHGRRHPDIPHPPALQPRGARGALRVRSQPAGGAAAGGDRRPGRGAAGPHPRLHSRRRALARAGDRARPSAAHEPRAQVEPGGRVPAADRKVADRMRAQTQPALDQLRDEAMQWGRKPRARGTWYVAEHMVRAMRAYGWTIIVGALGQPILYLLGLAVGLAAIIAVPIQDGAQEVPYLLFVAPALLMTAAISVASEEFTYPVMAGFKWRRYFYGFNASPLSSGQIANGVVMGASARMLVAVAAYCAFIWIFFAFLYPGQTTPATGWLSIPIGVLAGLAFGVPLMAYAGSIEDDKGQF